MKYIIKTENISKNYGKIKAVDGVSLEISKGEIYGFLGVNGAGKTTTIRMLLGMIKASEGEAFLYGERVSPGKKHIWKKVGYIVESPYSYPDLTVEENLEIVRRLRQLSDRKTVDEIITRLKLSPYRKRKTRNLSTGNLQRLGLAKALLHKPEILILDEPSNGLDPAGIAEVRKLLIELSNRGVTIFISSHILGEISKLVSRIGIIHQGQLIQDINKEKLEEFREKRLLLSTCQPEEAKKVLVRSGFKVRENKEGNLEIKDQKAVEHPEKIAEILVRAACPPTLLSVEKEDLESYFLRLIGITGGDVE